MRQKEDEGISIINEIFGYKKKKRIPKKLSPIKVKLKQPLAKGKTFENPQYSHRSCCS